MSASTGVTRVTAAERGGNRMVDTISWYLGFDWGSEIHAACLVDGTGQPVETFIVAHDATSVSAFLDRVLARTGGGPARIAVAIETPHGLVVAALMARGLSVYAINPKQLDRFRDRHTAAGAKDDRRDAFVLADSLRTDRPAFRRVQVEDQRLIELREYSRALEDVEAEHRRLANRVREHVSRLVPGWLRLCPAADEAWFWALLTRTLGRDGPRHLSRAAVAQLLRQHRIRRLTAEEVVTVLDAPVFPAAPGTAAAVAGQLGLLLPRLDLLRTQRRQCEARLDALLDALADEGPETERTGHRDVAILRSLPGVGRVVAATMLAEVAQPLAARDYHTLRAQAGTAPVTKQSGKWYRVVMMRRACNPRVRQAVHHWARVSVQHDAVTRQYYRQMRARGHSNGRALRAVADRWLRILTAMLRNGTLYNADHLASAA